jgi:hypothetical protein
MTDFVEVIYSPGGLSTDERRQLRHDGHKYSLIISGTLQANVGFESYELDAGDSIAFDSSTPARVPEQDWRAPCTRSGSWRTPSLAAPGGCFLMIAGARIGRQRSMLLPNVSVSRCCPG